MKINYSNKKISGIVTILPDNIVEFEDEIHYYSFPESKSLKLKKAMGFNSKRVVANPSTTSYDLVVEGFNYLFDNDLLDKNSVDAILFVSQSPEYIMPPTSNIIQGHFKFRDETFCMDINQGCAGFIVGLNQAFMLLENESINKVVLCNADVLSPKVSKYDRNSNPLIGDAAAITIIEKDSISSKIYGEILMDGSGALALNIPAGGARQPSSEKTSLLYEDDFGNKRSANDLVMRGDDVFNFVQTKVPKQILNVLEEHGDDIHAIDYFLFHQPNRFMLQKLADKLGVSRDKLPTNVVENYGNSSGVTIPLVIVLNLEEKLPEERFKVCFSGFGVGLTWGTIIMNLGKLDFCKQIYK